MATVVLNPDQTEQQNLHGVQLPAFWRNESTSPKSTREWWSKVLAPRLYGVWEEAKVNDHKAKLIRASSMGVVTFSVGWLVLHLWGYIPA
jgi:hypothetical protein